MNTLSAATMTVTEAQAIRDAAHKAYTTNRCPDTFQAYRAAGDMFARVATIARGQELAGRS